MKIISAITLAATLAFAVPAYAQKMGANGGPVVESDGHAIEFVSTDKELTFFIQDDDGSPMATTGLRGRAVVQDAGKTTTVALAPAAPNKLTGALPAPLAKGAKVVFSARVHDHSLQARFEKN